MSTRDHAGRTIEDTETELLDAMRESDLVALDRLISDQLTFIGPDGAVLTKQADLDAHRTGATSFDKIDVLSREAAEDAEGGHTTTVANAVLRAAEGTVSVRLTWHREWRVVDGRWQVVSGAVEALADHFD
ncbi:nuclear transport factor 2 family protein [Mycetocola tolaasinivorans]|uniref:Nuclear transport factor 2 family protein n=1 Tax=Mycetocola tolaasinivorans TaxID=76635 RepID=A0A3L6ZXL4_9MICO|nr:nuclear transport factor 2 family protein [Mycetocola tolaasinivorans]RLP71882.1 nuclear transport factor 2 family protein [Mycetocola tolaasinivorans]